MKSAELWRPQKLQEIEFRNWLINTGLNKKLASDNVSRLKRLENELDSCDIDEEYQRDKCQYLLSLFAKMGKNDNVSTEALCKICKALDCRLDDIMELVDEVSA